MVQMEVAQRLTARPGGKDYGAATICIQARSHIQIARRVPREVFYPRPQVESAIVVGELLGYEDRAALPDPAAVERVTQACFQRRRRKMRSSLLALFPGHAPEMISERLAIDLNRRPEELSVEDFVRMASYDPEQGRPQDPAGDA